MPGRIGKAVIEGRVKGTHLLEPCPGPGSLLSASSGAVWVLSSVGLQETHFSKLDSAMEGPSCWRGPHCSYLCLAAIDAPWPAWLSGIVGLNTLPSSLHCLPIWALVRKRVRFAYRKVCR